MIFAATAMLGVLGAIVTMVKPQSEFGRDLVGLLILQVFIFSSVLLHELGHAMGARAVGFKVQRVVVGFGRSLLVTRMFGFNVDFRTWPYGGLCYADPCGEKALLARYFVFVIAGPATNLAFVLAGYLMLGEKWTLSIEFDDATAFARIFVLANLFGVAESLFPFVIRLPEGKVPSDGLALYQILILRRLPYVPEQGTTSKRQRILHRVSKWIGVGLLGFASAFCLLIAGFFVWSSLHSWAAAAVVAGLAALLGWIMLNTVREPLPARGDSLRHALDQGALQELTQAERWVTNQEFVRVYGVIGRHVQEKQWAEAEAAIRSAMEQFPGSLYLRWCNANVLCATQRSSEAAEQFETMSRECGALGEAAKVVLAGEHIKAVVLTGDYAKARVICDRYLGELSSPSSRAALLDRVASLAVIDGLRAYAREAYAWCERALALAPESVTLLGTKASLLIELKRAQEGVPVLLRVYKQSRSQMDQGIAALYLAIACQQAGDAKNARRWSRRARLLHPEAWLIARLSEKGL